MKIVFLTSGPRGAGKTTFVNRFKKRYPKVDIISRDEMLIKFFGSTTISGRQDKKFDKILIKTLGDYLSKKSPNQRLILDCWNFQSGDRVRLIKGLRKLGADKVYCLYFVVPQRTCVRWFYLKNLDNWDKMMFDPKICHQVFYSPYNKVENDGFDGVIKIKPPTNNFSFFRKFN